MQPGCSGEGLCRAELQEAEARRSTCRWRKQKLRGPPQREITPVQSFSALLGLSLPTPPPLHAKRVCVCVFFEKAAPFTARHKQHNKAKRA